MHTRNCGIPDFLDSKKKQKYERNDKLCGRFLKRGMIDEKRFFKNIRCKPSDARMGAYGIVKALNVAEDFILSR